MHKIVDASLVCFDVALNFLVSDMTGKPPLKITHRTQIKTPLNNMAKDAQDKELPRNKQWNSKQYSNCINILVTEYGHLPLLYSISRADPVLFGDDVSALRKEFRRIESQK